MRQLPGNPARGPSRGAAAAVLVGGAAYAACGHDWDLYDPRLDPDGGSGGDAGLSVSSSGAGDATVGPASSGASSGAAGGAGGSPAACGNGIIDPPEECDDSNSDSTDGCDACAVICNGTDEFEDGATHHCYALLPASTWAAGVTGCAAWGGHLAAVTSQPELDFVRTFVSQNAWLGGNEIAQRGTWVWEDGEAWSFAPWNPGEPNDYGADAGGPPEDCLDLRPSPDAGTFGFNDESCAYLYAPLCERDPAGRTK